MSHVLEPSRRQRKPFESALHVLGSLKAAARHVLFDELYYNRHKTWAIQHRVLEDGLHGTAELREADQHLEKQSEHGHSISSVRCVVLVLKKTLQRAEEALRRAERQHVRVSVAVTDCAV